MDNSTPGSGSIRIIDDTILWELDHANNACIPLSEIAVIGEYTTGAGGEGDDWFIVFVNARGQWQTEPWYAENMDQLTDLLSSRFEDDFHISLLPGSTEWKSIVRYPKQYRQRPLFTIRRDNHPWEQYLVGKLFLRMGFAWRGKATVQLTSELQAMLRQEAKP